VPVTTPLTRIATLLAETHGVTDRIDFRLGHLLEPLGRQRVHYLVANPPYISDAEWEQVAPNVKDYEPELALRGGADGLDVIRPLIAGAAARLETPGQLVIEIATARKKEALGLAAEAGFENAHVLADHEALPRVLVADRP